MGVSSLILLALLIGFGFVAPKGTVVHIKGLNIEMLEFSGFGVMRNHYFWLPITAMFIHDGVRHLLNNILFTIPLSIALETISESVPFFWSFWLICGTVGSSLSGLVVFLRYGEIGLYQSTRGFSPAMYGGAFFLLLVIPHTTIGEVHWLCIWGYTFIPHIMKYKSRDCIIIAISILCCISGLIAFCNNVLLEPSITAIVLIYFSKCPILEYQYKLRNNVWPISTSDVISHLGGSLAGIFFAFFWPYFISFQFLVSFFLMLATMI